MFTHLPLLIGEMDPYVLIQYKDQEQRSSVATGMFWCNQVHVFESPL